MARGLRRANEHERVEALLSTYLDGRASQAERVMVERHLKSCADCARKLATLRATVVAVRDLPHVRAPRSFALPRSMAKQPSSAPWLYPLLRTATAIATFLFVVVVAGDLYTRFTLSSTSAPMVAPAALPPTLIAMQAAATPVPATTAVTALDLAAVPGTEAPSVAAKAAPPETPVEPPTEQPMGASGLGGGAGGVGQAPSTAAVAPTLAPAGQASEAATPQPTSTPLAAPTEIARVLAPQPPVALEQGGAYQIHRPVVNPLRIVESGLAIAVVALGVAAWIARRRNR
jgi:anti-sigma factor RsiW